jgi:hypothetical protein
MNAAVIVGEHFLRPYDCRHTQGRRGPRKLAPIRRSVNRLRRSHMTPRTQAPVPEEPVPLGQRLFDNVFLLLGAGLLIMLLLYTGWGLWEITSLPAGTLP